MMRSVLLSFTTTCLLLSACSGGARKPDVIPTLPGDGTAHTAKPPPMPVEVDESSDDPWADREDLIAAPRPSDPRPFELPPVERFSLKNGLSVIVVKSDKLPIVKMQLAVRAGEQDSPREKVGLAQFAASMLTKGTRTKSALQIAQSIDQVGGTLTANAGFESTVMTCAAMAKNLGTCTRLLADIAVNPTFPAAHMDEVRNLLHTLVRQRRDDAGNMAGAHLRNLLWGEENARGWPMSARTVEAVKRTDLSGWHRSWFKPNNAVLLVSGDVDAKAVRLAVQRSFRWWSRGKLPGRVSYPVKTLGGIKIRLVDMPGQTQSHIRVGQLGIAHNDPAYFDNMVMNYVLGGGAFSSRLMRVVRSEGGKTYGASSTFERSRDRGAFVMSTFTRSAETLATLKLLLQEHKKMRDFGPTDDEVRDAITHLTGKYATGFESPSDVATALLTADFHELGADYVTNYPLKMAAVTTKSARNAARKTLDPKQLAIVIVGDARAVEPQLRKAGWTYEAITHLQPIASYERKPQKLGPVDADSEKAAIALLEKALKAKGGAAKLKAIRNMKVVAKGKITVQKRAMPATLTRHFELPDKLRLDIDVRVGGATAQVVTLLSGRKAWNKQPGQGVVELPKEAVAELRKQIWRDHEFILLRHREKGTRVASPGPQTVGGVTYDVVTITSPDGQNSVTLYLDQKTHLISVLTFREQGIEAIESYADYRVVDGIQIAHRRQTKSLEALLQAEVTSVSFNIKTDAALFSKPE